ncbi:MAG: N-methyl-L-tryptophan oxidase [Chitinophagaceae bacterium]|nr:N-methyl-L-tryptophan oxidase [Chitinophagaceae bacterium]
MKHYDVIVTGVGTMGAPACWYLAKNKYRVLGLEQFDIPHDQGSHAGQSRIIRKAYYEHPNYVALLERAYQNWREIEKATGAQLYYKTGLLYFGGESSVLINGTRETAKQFNIPLDILTADEAAPRFPAAKFHSHHQVLYEPDAGFITPEKAIAVYTVDAISKGADIHAREKLMTWKYTGGIIEVETDKAKYTADKIVICAGAWTKKIMPGLQADLTITRQLIAWVKPKHWEKFTIGNFSCWFLNDDDGNLFYGFPVLPPKDFSGPVGLKLAHHKPGEPTDPDNVTRSFKPGEEKILIDVFNKYFPGAAENVLTLKTCLYNNSADADFIIDFIPGTDSHAVVATGFSGHGFKFGSAVGEIVADLATKGKTDMPIGFLRLDRFK